MDYLWEWVYPKEVSDAEFSEGESEIEIPVHIAEKLI